MSMKNHIQKNHDCIISQLLKVNSRICFHRGIGSQRRDHLDPAPDISTDMD